MRQLIWFVAAVAWSQAASERPALEGFDPVLLIEGKDVPGKPEFNAKHGRFLYVFANAETRDRFLKDPERHAIQLDGSCARMGPPVGGSPDAYHVHEGRIYVFGSSDCYDLFKQDPKRYIEKPQTWSPRDEDRKRGAAVLAEVRTAMGLNGVTAWTEVRKGSNNQRTLKAIPPGIEAETRSANFAMTEIVTPDKVERKMRDRVIPVAGTAAKALRANYSRELLWLLLGGLDVVSDATGTLSFWTGVAVVNLEVDKTTGRASKIVWNGRASDGSTGEIRIVLSDYKQVGKAWLPFKGEATADGRPDAALSYTVESVMFGNNASAWRQWGGPDHNFHVEWNAKPWPDGGPKQIWKRALGDGYSSIVSDGSHLYTMYRSGDQEAVVAVDASSGKTLWEHRYAVTSPEGFVDEQGLGPRATPLLDGDLVISNGMSGIVTALRKETGAVAWSIDLQKQFGTTIRARGNSISPISWKDHVILLAGGKDAAVVAVRKKDGSIAWRRHNHDISYASPMIMQAAGRNFLVAVMTKEILGLDPDTGDIVWSHPHANQVQVNASTPVAGPDGILFVSSAYDGGCRALQVSASGVKELWSHRLLRIHHANAVRIGDVVYGSSGDMGPAPLTAVDVKTGKMLWRDRSLGKASMLAVNGKLLLLDEDGMLTLAAIDGQGPKVLARTQLFQSLSWTVPTVVDGRLYARNRQEMAAYELP